MGAWQAKLEAVGMGATGSALLKCKRSAYICKHVGPWH